MHSEHVISGVGHLALIGWLLFGSAFGASPPPLQVTEVSVLSEAEFQSLFEAQTPPEQLSEVVQPAAPEVTPDAPDVNATADASVEQPTPEVAETQPADTLPTIAETPPEPDANVSDEAPELPDPPAEVAVLVPEVAPTPVERPADRVAPEPVAQPDPEVTPDTTEETAVTPSETGEKLAEPTEATAAPEATDKIVTEADDPPAAAPTKSFRPPSRRPEPPKPQVAEAPQTAPIETDDAVKAALADALSSAQAEVPTGPPLTSGEKDGLRVAVQKCWNVGTLSSEAMRTTVVIKVAMTPEGRPVNSSIQLINQSGGTDASARQAFEAGRRAIIRCGASGYDLPADKYGQWKDIEITFDPERMR